MYPGLWIARWVGARVGGLCVEVSEPKKKGTTRAEPSRAETKFLKKPTKRDENASFRLIFCGLY